WLDGSEVEHVPDVAEHVTDAVAEATDAVPEGIEPAADRVEAAQAAEHHAHEHHVHDAGAAEVAGGVGLVGRAAVPVRHALGADHHLADVGLGPDPHAL